MTVNGSKRNWIGAIISLDKNGRLNSIQYDESRFGLRESAHAVIVPAEGIGSPAAWGPLSEGELKAKVYTKTGLDAEGIKLPDKVPATFSGYFLLLDSCPCPCRTSVASDWTEYSPELIARAKQTYHPEGL